MRFELKTLKNQQFGTWCLKLMGLPRVTKKIYQVEAKKALTYSRLLLPTRHH